MHCLICQNLEAALEARQSEYIGAASSAYDRVSTRFAAYRNVEMERARAELLEHRMICLTAANESLLSTGAGLQSRGLEQERQAELQQEKQDSRVGAAA